MTAPTPRPRSCPTCHSIGAPRIVPGVVPGVPDMLCMDVWHHAPPAPTGPEPEERAGMCGDLAPIMMTGAPQLLCDLRAGHADWHEGGEHRTSWTHEPTDAAAQVSALQAEVIEAQRERDRARRCLREHADCAEPDCQAEIQAALGVGPDPAEEAASADVARLEAERDEALARVEVAIAAYQRELAGHVTAQRERDEALAERDTYRSAVEMYEGGIDELAVERDAMRAAAVEAAGACVKILKATVHRAAESDWLREETRALIAAVDQMGARTAQREPGSDGSGSGVGEDVAEAEKGARGATCLCAEVDVSLGYKGYRETIRGRTNPECPFHGREVRTDG